MSKALKSIGRAVKKSAKWVTKNIVPILAVAALVYTGGAAMGFFQGVAGGGGLTGMAGIQAAWGGGAAAASTAGTASAALEGGAATAATAGTTAATGAAATGAAATEAAGVTGSLASGGALSVGAAVPTLPASLTASGGLMAAPTAAAAGSGGIGLGTALLASSGVQAGGAYMQAKSAEDAADEERAREAAKLDKYNQNMYAYGVNRVGTKDANYTGGDWDSVMRAAPAGLMAPRAAAPAPQTIDELIRARQQGTA